MSAAIGNIIYGVPLTEAVQQAVADHEHVDTDDLDDSFFEDDLEMLYSAGGVRVSPGYCGVLITSFSECDEPQLVSNFVKLFKTRPEQEAEAITKVKKLPEHVRFEAPAVGLYLIWSSS